MADVEEGGAYDLPEKRAVQRCGISIMSKAEGYRRSSESLGIEYRQETLAVLSRGGRI